MSRSNSQDDTAEREPWGYNTYPQSTFLGRDNLSTANDLSYPDPHEFYRLPAPPTADILVEPTNMTGAGRQRSLQSNSARPAPRPAVRSASGPTSTSSLASKSSSSVPATSRPPVRSLVDRFNQPTSAPSQNRYYRPPRASLGSQSKTAQSPTSGSSRADAVRNKLFKPKVKSTYPPALGPSVTVGGVSGVGEKQNVAAMMMRSPHRQSFYGNGGPSLFGEIALYPDGALDFTQAPVHPGERQSFFDGSMHRPNEMFPRGAHGRTRSSQDVPMYTDVQSTSLPASMNQSSHRKSRSEAYNSPVDPQAPPVEPLTLPAEIRPSEPRRKSSPKSRIPVRSRKMSGATSDSGSSMSSRAGSSLSESRYTSVSPPKDSRLPTAPRPRAVVKTNGSSSNMRPATPPQTLSARRYGTSSPNRTPKASSNGSLKAVIHAPPLPKTSPTLRTSRSRQPLSAASNAASRAKGNTSDSNPSSATRGSHSKTPTKVKRTTGLAGVNFAERRKLFETSSQESLRKPDTSLRRKKSSLSTTAENPKDFASEPPLPIRSHSQTTLTSIETAQAGTTHHANVLSLETGAENIDQGAESHGEATEFETDDSPVMDLPGQFPLASPPTQHETASSSPALEQQQATDVSNGGQEPRLTYSAAKDKSTRSGAQQAFNMGLENHARDSGYEIDSRPHTQFYEDMSPDKMDAESIQIMLGATPGLGNFQQTWDPRSFEQHGAGHAEHQPASLDTTNDTTFLHEEDDSPIDPFGHMHRQIRPAQDLEPTSRQDEPVRQNPAIALTSGLTVDPQSYNSLRDLLDYYKTEAPSAEMANQIHDVVKRSISPNLAARGNWHSRTSSVALLSQVVQEVEAAAPPFAAEEETEIQYLSMETPDGLDHSPDPDYTGTAIILTQPQRYSKDPISRAPWEQAGQGAAMSSNEPWRSSDEYSSIEDRNSTSFDIAHPQLPEIQNTGGNLGLAIKVTTADDGSMPHGRISPLNRPPPDRRASPSKQHMIPRRSPPPPSTHKYAHIASLTSAASAPHLPLDAPSDQHRSLPPPIPGPLPDQLPVVTVEKDSPEGKRLMKRRNLLRELLDTEDSYHIDIVILNEIYKDSSHMIMTEDDRKTLFSNSDKIREFSMEFKEALKEAVAAVYVQAQTKQWQRDGSVGSEPIPEVMHLDDQRDRQTFVGATIERHLGQMENIYGEYIKNHSLANARLAALTNNKDTAQKMKAWMDVCIEQSNALTKAWNLDALLVKPTQRVLKYPLIMRSLLECTPKDHPDYESLVLAEKSLLQISSRINENTKRAELMNQVITKNKKQDGKTQVSTALSRAFGRRKIEFKENVGLGTTVDDPVYDAIAQKFGGHFFQLQVVMRDVEKYLADVQVFMDSAATLVSAINDWAELGHQGNVPRVAYPEIESKWRKYGQTIRDLAVIALPEHRAIVLQSVVKPIQALWKLHDNPQVMMYKRKKKMAEYIRYKNAKEKGEKLDKKLMDAGETWMAVNETLKLELPKLYVLSKKLVEAAFTNFIDIQVTWQLIWKKKLATATEEPRKFGDFRDDLKALENEFLSDFNVMPSEVDQYAICNRSILNDTANFLSPTFSASMDDSMTSKRTSNKTLSVSSDKSIHNLAWMPTMASQASQAYSNQPPWLQQAGAQSAGRWPASASSSNLPLAHPTPDMYDGTPQTSPRHNKFRISAGGYSSGSSTPRINNMDVHGGSMGYNSSRPNTGLRTESTPQAGRGSFDVVNSPPPRPSTHTSNHNNDWSLPNERSSSIFSSAMPMSDSSAPTRPDSPASGDARDPDVLYLAASLFEFKIAHDRREGGYPYLTYNPGEVFDVLGTKGELWLARNQDDSDGQVGWIWEKHFARILTEEP